MRVRQRQGKASEFTLQLLKYCIISSFPYIISVLEIHHESIGKCLKKLSVLAE